jgi:integral membrane protein
VDIVRTLRVISLAEAISFLLLLVATGVKYGAGLPQGVKVLGPVHGMLFLGYVALVLVARGRLGWSFGRTVLALIAAVLPVAPLLVERFWLRGPRPVPAGAVGQWKSDSVSAHRR